MADEPPNPSISASAAAAAALDSLCLDDKFERIRSVAEDFEDEDELRRLLATKPNPVAFDGFEPSGRMHIAEGILKAINVKQLISAGCTVKLWVADYFALLNNKMGADLKKIQTVGKYMIEIWKAMGLDCEKVEFLVCSEEINRRPKEYWERVLDIATRNSVARISRCSQIMGVEKDELTAGQIFYPCMQCADVFFLEGKGFLTLVASSLAEITDPSFHELIRREASSLASRRNTDRSRLPLKNSVTVDLKALCASPTTTDMESLPATFLKASGQPGPNNLGSFFRTNLLSSPSADTITWLPIKFERNILPNLQHNYVVKLEFLIHS